MGQVAALGGWLQDPAQPVLDACPATPWDVLIVALTVSGPVLVAYFAGKARERSQNGR